MTYLRRLNPAAHLAAALCLTVLTACGTTELENPPTPMGNFALGLNVVVADNVQKGPVTREVTPDQWEASMSKAMADRFGRYEGDKLFNFGIGVDGYALAPPGIPVVAAPKSALILTVNVWDDAAQKLLTDEGHRITVVEDFTADSVIGSGWSQSKEQQMDKLAFKAALAIQNWLLADHPDWFGLPPKGTADAAAAAN